VEEKGVLNRFRWKEKRKDKKKKGGLWGEANAGQPTGRRKGDKGWGVNGYV